MDFLRTITEVQDLHRHFQVGEQTIHALNGVDLAIQEGEFLAMMGPSGSGKSTLLYLLGGLDRATKGWIWVRDREDHEPRDLGTMDEDALAAYRGQQIGFVFQSFHLISTLTARQNVAFPLVFAQVPADVRHKRATTLLEQMGLGDRLDHRPTELSGGQQQRVAIARALVNNPALLLADEPTGNLDSHTGHEILELLSDLNRHEGRTIVIVSHDPSVTEHASRTVYLQDGRISDERTRST